MTKSTLWFGDIQYHGPQLKLNYGFDALRFSTTYWYQGVDLDALVTQFGQAYMQKVFFHILAFEANKLLSLAPKQIDPGPYAAFCTPSFAKLWRKIGHHVWAQWRYQHDLPDYQVPYFPDIAPINTLSPVTLEAGDIEVLAFCGGGKDSLVSLQLLKEADIPYASFAYAHSIYGNAAHQHQLIDQMIDQAPPIRRHHQWISDDFVDSPVLELFPEWGLEHHLAAETPSSIFGVMPLILTEGYRYIALAHERSADRGNLIWDATGEDVNHQWGKSLEAENLLNTYLQAELVENFSYFSLLKSLYDVVIFNSLKRDPEAVRATHSCNIQKPWCRRCPKCAYVWINYMAYLEPALINDIFAENLLDLPENQWAYRQMLGLEDHTPFECIGQIQEVQLAFELCHRKGLTGQAMDTYLNEVKKPDWHQVLAKHGQVDTDVDQLPVAFRAGLKPLIEQRAEAARQDVLKALNLSLVKN